MELEEQQPPQEKYTTSRKKSLLEATAIQVLDDFPQQQPGVVIQPHIVSSPAPSVKNNNNSVIQCCYKVSALLSARFQHHAIHVAAESQKMVGTRDIRHICFISHANRFFF